MNPFFTFQFVGLDQSFQPIFLRPGPSNSNIGRPNSGGPFRQVFGVILSAGAVLMSLLIVALVKLRRRRATAGADSQGRGEHGSKLCKVTLL